MMQTDTQVRVLNARIERLESENKRLKAENGDVRGEFDGLSRTIGDLRDENDRFRNAIVSKDNSLLRLVRQAKDALEEEFGYGGAYIDLLDAMYEALGEKTPVEKDDKEKSQ